MITEGQLKKIFQGKYRKKDKDGNVIPSFQNVTFEEFTKWFKQEEYDKGCVFCGTTHERSLELAKLRPKATRQGKRAQRLELDRQDPFKPYDNLLNLKWCCYWCNNAKSNFFSPAEFAPVGKAIGEALKSIRYTNPDCLKEKDG